MGLTVLDENEQELGMLRNFMIEKEADWGELIIKFSSKGFNDPGSMYGGPHNLGYPPESDDERLLTIVYIQTHIPTIGIIKLPEEVQDELFEIYKEDIYEVELEDD